MLSVIIPSRVDQYLQKTIDDILEKATGEIEIIVVLDGYWPEPALKDDPRIILVHQGMVHDNFGMRAAINAAVSISRGEYIMKCDEHVMFEKGFNEKLIADCEDDWMVIPRRYRLDAEKWEVIEDGRAPIDYMILDYPYQRPYDKTCGLHGAEDRETAKKRQHVLIDDCMTMQGSCWFMPRKLWDRVIVRMEEENYGTFTQEAQELSMKVWLSGGRVVVNKKTWYAHLHKGKKGKGYGFSNAQYAKHMEGTERGRLFCIDFWLNDKWDKMAPGRNFEWLIQKFWPLPGWGENWKEDVKRDAQFDYSKRHDT
jgi:glycosyltransferase involved in cell wall biosynthesis